MQAEEDGRPREVEYHLDGERSRTDPRGIGGEALLPDESERRSDHRVEHGPDGGEDPIGWIARGLIKRAIPGVDGLTRDDAAE